MKLVEKEEILRNDLDTAEQFNEFLKKMSYQGYYWSSFIIPERYTNNSDSEFLVLIDSWGLSKIILANLKKATRNNGIIPKLLKNQVQRILPVFS